MDKRIEDFCVGDSVIHPKHGAGTIFDIKHQTIAGVTDLYYTIHIKGGTAMLPTARARELGLRQQTDADLDLDAVRMVLKRRLRNAPKSSPAKLRELHARIFQGSAHELALTVHELRQATPGSQLYELLKLGIELLTNLVASEQGYTLEEAFAVLNDGLSEPLSKHLLTREPAAKREVVPPHPMQVTTEQTRHRPVLAPSAMEARMGGASRGTLPSAERTKHTYARAEAPTVLRVLSGPTREFVPEDKGRKQKKSRRANPDRAARVRTESARPEAPVAKALAVLKGFADLEAALDAAFVTVKGVLNAPVPQPSETTPAYEPKSVAEPVVTAEPEVQAEETTVEPDLPYADLVAERDHLQRTVGDLIARLFAAEAVSRAANLNQREAEGEVTGLRLARDNAQQELVAQAAAYAELKEKHVRLVGVARRWQAANEALTAEKLALEEGQRVATTALAHEQAARLEAEARVAQLEAELATALTQVVAIEAEARSAIATAAAECEALQNETASLRAQLETARAQNEAVEKTKTEQARTVTALQKQIDELEAPPKVAEAKPVREKSAGKTSTKVPKAPPKVVAPPAPKPPTLVKPKIVVGTPADDPSLPLTRISRKPAESASQRILDRYRKPPVKELGSPPPDHPAILKPNEKLSIAQLRERRAALLAKHQPSRKDR